MKKPNRSVCVFGTFDIVHPGHLWYLSSAAALGRKLIVVVTPDRVVIRRKGVRPLCNQQERIALVSALRIVDKVVLGDTNETWSIILHVKPSCICLGYDQESARRSLIRSAAYQQAGSPPVVMAGSYRPRTYHSRILKS